MCVRACVYVCARARARASERAGILQSAGNLKGRHNTKVSQSLGDKDFHSVSFQRGKNLQKHVNNAKEKLTCNDGEKERDA